MGLQAHNSVDKRHISVTFCTRHGSIDGVTLSSRNDVPRTHRTIRPVHLVLLSYVLLGALSTAIAQSKNGFDIADALVPIDEILWGGVGRDGIPSINQPKFVAASDANFLSKKDRVLGVYRNGIAKAYPIRILDRHEVVNDYFGDEVVVVTYCPLCFSGMAFSIDTDSIARTFGVSGLLFNSDVLLYDHQTGSLWSQIRSQAISGVLKGTEIRPVVAAHTTWRDWLGRYPNTQVLSTDTGFRMNYRKSPYTEYQRRRQLMFPVENRSNQYSNKELVLGITIGDTFKAYPFKELRKQDRPSFDDSIGDTAVTIKWHEKEKFARAISSDGEEIPTVIVYWFAWYAFHPTTAIFQAGSG